MQKFVARISLPTLKVVIHVLIHESVQQQLTMPLLPLFLQIKEEERKETRSKQTINIKVDKLEIIHCLRLLLLAQTSCYWQSYKRCLILHDFYSWVDIGKEIIINQLASTPVWQQKKKYTIMTSTLTSLRENFIRDITEERAVCPKKDTKLIYMCRR